MTINGHGWFEQAFMGFLVGNTSPPGDSSRDLLYPQVGGHPLQPLSSAHVNLPSQKGSQITKNCQVHALVFQIYLLRSRSFGYLEDHPMTCKWLATMVSKSPK